ncbi:MAG: 3-deoxy-7-phosphoheptulonate synthase [Spirochaetales bacterium]|nr:3-deoxy-7-phosphoheptulonate synthase [Spirochaetales bacterium]
MIVVLEHNAKESDILSLKSFLKEKGFKVHEIVGQEETILGAVGIAHIDLREVEILPGVARVIPITKPFKLASREFKKEDTVVKVGPIKIGGQRIVVIAGPCAVESRKQIIETAKYVKEAGAVILRGGAFKPRTSPYSFQGLGEKGLKYLKDASEITGMPIISEIVSIEHLDMFKEYVDILQIGARNMQNFELLKKVGALGKPVLLKRGLAATINDLLMSAEYLLANGNDSVILCERGIKTFETYTRNTLDLSAIPVVKKLSHLPIMVDPSHGTGIRNKVPPMALAAIAAGSDGLMVEVHLEPEKALSDGPQSLYPEQFEKLMRDIEALAPVLGKEVYKLSENRDDFRTVRVGESGFVKTGTGKLPRIGFQGERGAFSEKAIYSYFQEDVEPVAFLSFKNIFDAILKNNIDYGVIPIENSLAGSIHENYDLLLRYPDIRIVGEKKIRIMHSLIGLPNAETGDIKKVFSHPQGLAQCGKYLESHNEWELVPYYDTAGAVAFIAREGRKENAAIAGRQAAAVYKMKVFKEGIETNPQNYTRFFIITREGRENIKNPDKSSFVVSTLDRPGSLYLTLKILAGHRLNMKKLESRPFPGKPWEYMFYIDVELPDNPAVFNKAIDEIKKNTDYFRILGIYKS